MTVDINLGSKLDAKGFKQAETALNKLNKQTKTLGKTLTRTLGAAAILALGRASVKAFAEDEKAAASLGQTLKNLGLAYGSNIGTVNGYISRLEEQTGVLDDELRPAMDRLLRATGDVVKSQELLNLALDIAAGTGKSVTQVSQSLQKAYLGQTQAIGRLGVGLSKAEILSSSFEEIQQKLTTLFAGQAVTAAETYAGRLDKLAIAANNAKETIGLGLVDAITALSGGGATAATDNIEKLSKGVADTLKNTGELIAKLAKLKPVLIAFGVAAAVTFAPIATAIAGVIFLLGDLNKRLDEQSFRKGIIPGGFGNINMSAVSQDTSRSDASAAKKAAAAQLKLMKEQAAAQAKILRDKRLGIAIDKASVLLGKGGDVFDIDKIQNQAALINQAELLGKATTATQILQITNDTARLNVKKAISDLEDAIAAKDEAAIIAATKKLNAELAILSAVSQQNIKLVDIKTVLDSLKEKDLINLKNLTDAILLLTQIGGMGLKGSTTTSITTDAAAQATAILAAKTAAEKAAAEAAKAAAEAAKAALDAANADAASAAAKAKAAADAKLAAAQALTAEEKARAAAMAAAAAAEIARLDAARKAAEEYAAALLEAADAAAAVADALSVGGTTTGTATAADGSLATVISETGKEVTKLTDGLATVFQTVEDSAAFNALVNSFAGGTVGSFNAGSFRATEGGSLFNSGAVGSRDRDIIINVTAGVGDPNAIAEAIDNVLRSAAQRGTLVA
jgi:hypothetical protein